MVLLPPGELVQKMLLPSAEKVLQSETVLPETVQLEMGLPEMVQPETVLPQLETGLSEMVHPTG